MDGWIDGWMDRWMDGKIDSWMERQIDGWMDRWMDGWIDRQIWAQFQIAISSPDLWFDMFHHSEVGIPYPKMTTIQY